AAGRRQPTSFRVATPVGPVAPRASWAGRVTPQAFYGPGRGSCGPSTYYRSPRISFDLSPFSRLGSLERLSRSTSSVHPVDIKTLEDRYELQSDCPGMGEDDVTVEVSPDRVLTVSGSRKSAKHAGPSTTAANISSCEERPAATTSDEEGSAAADGRAPSSPPVTYRFSRSFLLPDDAEMEGVEAALERGVLMVSVPRQLVEKQQPRRVIVKGSAAAGPMRPERPSMPGQ
ncbi:Heat shock protein, chloroplastic, partial [Tetrabaena socialis]